MKKIRSSQTAILCTELSKTQLFLVSIGERNEGMWEIGVGMQEMAICNSRNEESGNGMREMWRMRVGMQGIGVIMPEIWVGMWGMGW